jgi:hypothetical protein
MQQGEHNVQFLCRMLEELWVNAAGPYVGNRDNTQHPGK